MHFKEALQYVHWTLQIYYSEYFLTHACSTRYLGSVATGKHEKTTSVSTTQPLSRTISLQKHITTFIVIIWIGDEPMLDKNDTYGCMMDLYLTNNKVYMWWINLDIFSKLVHNVRNWLEFAKYNFSKTSIEIILSNNKHSKSLRESFRYRDILSFLIILKFEFLHN